MRKLELAYVNPELAAPSDVCERCEHHWMSTYCKVLLGA